MVEDFFAPEELQPCRDSISEMVDNLADKLHKAGKITGDPGPSLSPIICFKNTCRKVGQDAYARASSWVFFLSVRNNFLEENCYNLILPKTQYNNFQISLILPETQCINFQISFVNNDYNDRDIFSITFKGLLQKVLPSKSSCSHDLALFHFNNCSLSIQ